MFQHNFSDLLRNIMAVLNLKLPKKLSMLLYVGTKGAKGLLWLII